VRRVDWGLGSRLSHRSASYPAPLSFPNATSQGSESGMVPPVVVVVSQSILIYFRLFAVAVSDRHMNFNLSGRYGQDQLMIKVFPIDGFQPP